MALVLGQALRVKQGFIGDNISNHLPAGANNNPHPLPGMAISDIACHVIGYHVKLDIVNAGSLKTWRAMTARPCWQLLPPMWRVLRRPRVVSARRQTRVTPSRRSSWLFCTARDAGLNRATPGWGDGAS